MKNCKIFVCSLLVSISFGSFSQTTQTSNFTSNADGWTIFNLSSGSSFAPAYSATGGNPGGFINDGGTVVGPIIFYAEAPVKFRGNFLAAYNQNLTFDLRNSFVGSDNANGDVVIQNSSIGVTLNYQLPSKPGSAFTSYTIKLSETFAGWHVGSPTGPVPTAAQMQNVLSNITLVRIRTKYTTANTSIATGAIDNVVLNVVTMTITDQPDELTVCVGTTGTFTAAATGATNITYQWQYSSSGSGPFSDIANGGGYSNVTTPTVSINTTGNFGGGHYRCKINGDFVATQFTNDAELHVTTVTPPTTAPATSCQNATATLTASGGTNGQYRWYTTSSGPSQIAGQFNSTYVTPDQVATGTFTYYVSITNGSCESTRTPVAVTVSNCPANQPPVIASTTVSIGIGGFVDLDLTSLISDPDNNVDLSTITIVSPPASNVSTTLTATHHLLLDYASVPFSGTDRFTIKVCDVAAACTTRELLVEVSGDITIYNGLSPNGDGLNEIFLIMNIQALPSTRKNKVHIFNRWGDEVFSIDDYNNMDRVFRGLNNSGSELPNGIYFYKIEFGSGRKEENGFLSLRR